MDKEKHFSKFNSVKRLLCVLLVFAMLAGIAALAQGDVLGNAREVEDVDNLSGQRIGCCVGWETDVLLTDRTDLTLMRYDSESEAIMALGYNQVDAVGLDEVSWEMIKSNTTGLETLGDPISHIGYVTLFSKDDEELAEEFNTFLMYFQKTEEYEEYRSRALFRNSSQFEYAEVKELSPDEAEKTIRIGYNPENYPESFPESSGGVLSGYGTEIIKRFALANNYAIEWVEGSSTSLPVDTSAGKLDMFMDEITDVYRVYYEDRFIMSNPYLQGDVVVVRVAEGQKLVIKETINM